MPHREALFRGASHVSVRPKRLPPQSPGVLNSLCSLIKMARPPKEKKEKRSFRYTFRMTEEEMEFLERLSSYSGLPSAEVIRASVFKNRLPQARVPLLDRQAYLELKRIGNNINQIARHYNSRITVPEHRLKVFNNLSDKLDSVIKALIDDR
ncbi:MAG: plasmid mobilization relaxosome protein MobC [Anditalea sp.]